MSIRQVAEHVEHGGSASRPGAQRPQSVNLNLSIGTNDELNEAVVPIEVVGERVRSPARVGGNGGQIGEEFRYVHCSRGWNTVSSLSETNAMGITPEEEARRPARCHLWLCQVKCLLAGLHDGGSSGCSTAIPAFVQNRYIILC